MLLLNFFRGKKIISIYWKKICMVLLLWDFDKLQFDLLSYNFGFINMLQKYIWSQTLCATVQFAEQVIYIQRNLIAARTFSKWIQILSANNERQWEKKYKRAETDLVSFSQWTLSAVCVNTMWGAFCETMKKPITFAGLIDRFAVRAPPLSNPSSVQLWCTWNPTKGCRIGLTGCPPKKKQIINYKRTIIVNKRNYANDLWY